MRKVGILSFWNIPNYGGFMQLYALQKVLSKRYIDSDVKQIAYLNKSHFDAYYSVLDKSFKNCFINLNFYRKLYSNLKRCDEIKKIKNFIKYYEYIPHYNVINNNLDNLNLDVLVLGSDIIWDYNVKFFGNDKYLFGNNIKALKKISYAPSFGTVTEKNKIPEYVKLGLKNLTDISVRDKKSKLIAEKICNKNVEIVLDPTLMWNFIDDSNIVEPSIKERYIIVYGSFFSDELIKDAKDYCKSNNIKMICLNSLDDRFEWCDFTINQEKLSPFEWAGYFKNAHAIMTSTYHGLLFGIIFKKKIVFYPTNFIVDKAEEFIEKLNLRKVLLEITSFRGKLFWEWNYEKIYRELNKEREKSFAYLDRNLKND